jgi:diacylglycerol kinase (ATP)
MKTMLIINPTAARGKMRERWNAIEATLRAENFAFDFVFTERPWHAVELTRAALDAGCDLIVAVGGDGTLNEVINGIARRASKVCIGLVPLGTGNDFARSLGLPATVDENIDILLSAKTTPIDFVRVESDRTRYFVNVSAGGFSGIVDEKLTPEIKHTWGPLAYIRSAAAALPELHAYRTDLVFDDEERLSVELYNVVIGNGRFVAGGLPIAPDADLSDGLLDVVVIPKRPATEMALLAAEILLGKHLSSNAIIFRRAKKIAVRSRPGMWFNVDGELVGNEPAVFQVVPRGLNFVVNKR